MRLRGYFLAYFFVFVANSLCAAPMVQNIANKTSLGFEIISHSDISTCSLHKSGKVIEACSLFQQGFLLERGKPCLILRPVYYCDPLTNTKMPLVDTQQNFDADRIDAAYNAWKKQGRVKKFANSQDWLNRWVGRDIEIKLHTIEVFGYLINLSRVKIHNSISQQAKWLSFAKGVFSRLILEIDIVQRRKGIFLELRVAHGEGGICRDGAIERLF